MEFVPVVDGQACGSAHPLNNAGGTQKHIQVGKPQLTNGFQESKNDELHLWQLRAFMDTNRTLFPAVHGLATSAQYSFGRSCKASSSNMSYNTIRASLMQLSPALPVHWWVSRLHGNDPL